MTSQSRFFNLQTGNSTCTRPFHPHHGHTHHYDHQGTRWKGHRGLCLWKSAPSVWFLVDGEGFVWTASRRKRLPGTGRETQLVPHYLVNRSLLHQERVFFSPAPDKADCSQA